MRLALGFAALTIVLGPCELTSLRARDIVGTWGGENAALIADDTSAHIHIGCTYGDVHQQIVPGPDGRFDVPGEHDITAYPVDRGTYHPARYRGQITGGGRTMTLTIQLTDTSVTLGPVLLTFDKTPRMGPCPICRSPNARRNLRARTSRFSFP